MNRTEYLLVCLAEECNEVAQRVMKGLRFGLGETQPGKDKDNVGRINEELCDLVAVVGMLENEGTGIKLTFGGVLDKVSKVERYFEYSKGIGVVS